MTELQKVIRETVSFMRGKYKLNEHGNGKNELKFKCGDKTILTIYIYEDRLDFLIIFGKKEREAFEEKRESFSSYVCAIYDNTKTFHDGKWMTFPVSTLEQLEEIKHLIRIKKKPNRKPLPSENMIISKCGHRCDLCVHYTGGTVSEEFRGKLAEHLTRVYNNSNWSMRCPGCYNKPENDICDTLKCAAKKNCDTCLTCSEYPCETSPVGYKLLESRNMLADDITYAILPYVEDQYGNNNV